MLRIGNAIPSANQLQRIMQMQDEELRRSLDETRRVLRKDAKLGVPDVTHPFDLSETRIFSLTHDGILDIDAHLNADDYADLISWSGRARVRSIIGPFMAGTAIGAIILSILFLIANALK